MNNLHLRFAAVAEFNDGSKHPNLIGHDLSLPGAGGSESQWVGVPKSREQAHSPNHATTSHGAYAAAAWL
jgi:hypothetical protein